MVHARYPGAMPPLPTIGNCVRVTINWSTYGGVTPRNVIHLITASEDGAAIGAALDEAFDTYPDAWQILQSSFALQSYSVLPLDGTSATQEIAHTGDPVVGGGGGNMVPAAGGVLSLRTLTRGPQGRGRLYIGPTGENVITDGIIGLSYINSAITSWQGVQDVLADAPINASLGVASYTHAEVHGVTSISMRAPAGTQRRRQNQLVS